MTKSAPHTKLCTTCCQILPTGMSVGIYEKWRDNRGQRGAIERSMATINRDFDESLLTQGTCFKCSLNEYTNGEGIEVLDEDS